MNDADKRKLLKAHHAEYDLVMAHREALMRAREKWFDNTWPNEYARRGGPPQTRLPALPSFPPELIGMTCAAKTRAGTPCKLTSIYRNGRCKLHGGLSTGPRTDVGRKRSALNGNAPKTKRTP